MQSPQIDRVHAALDRFRIELPSWGFANTGTRFGKFLQPAAAATIEEKFADAGQVHALTGVCPTRRAARPLGLPRRRRQRRRRSAALAERHGVRAGLDQSESVPGPGLQVRLARQPRPGGARARALEHIRRQRRRSRSALRQPRHLAVVRRRLELSRARPTSASASSGSMEGLAAAARQRSRRRSGMLVEYKPFEPAFYHTDIADWGMALLLAQRGRAAGAGAGRHRASLPGAEHRADRRVAARRRHARRLPLQRPPLRRRRPDARDRSIRTRCSASSTRSASSSGRPARRADIAYMVDQSHNLKGKIEAMIQTVDDGAGAVREGRAGRSRARCAPHRRVRSWSPRSRCCRTPSRPTCGPRFASGGGTRDFRWTRCARFARAAISNESPRSAPSRNAAAVSS